MTRCFGDGDELYAAYHDDEWGRPVRDERGLFERLCLEGFQSGLSWLIILRKRDGFRAAFADFEPDAVARFGPEDVERLMGDAGIVRNRRKIEATVANARATVDLRDAGTPLQAAGLEPPPGARASAVVVGGRPRPAPGGRRPGQGPSSARASASWGRRPSTPRCRPAGWSTTTSPPARCARRSSTIRRPPTD